MVCNEIMSHDPYQSVFYCSWNINVDVDRLIGWNLKRIRESRNFSQDDVADLMANIDQPLLSKIERATRTINSITLYKLARGFRLSPGEFYNTVGAPKDILGDLDNVVIPVRTPRPRKKDQ